MLGFSEQELAMSMKRYITAIPKVRIRRKALNEFKRYRRKIILMERGDAQMFRLSNEKRSFTSCNFETFQQKERHM